MARARKDRVFLMTPGMDIIPLPLAERCRKHCPFWRSCEFEAVAREDELFMFSSFPVEI